MTRQAAPPAQRWLLLLVLLLLSPWLGQGVAAGASSIAVDPPSGVPGTTVTVTLTDFLDACVVLFDNELVATGVGCADTSLSFVIPDATSVGEHEIRAVGQADADTAEQSVIFRVTAAAAPSTTTQTNPSTTAVGEVPAGTATTVAGTATTVASRTSTPPASVPGTGTAPAAAAGCPDRQVALARFGLRSTRGRPGAFVSATTSWGSSGTCTDVRPLLVLFDGKPLAGRPPAAGTPGSFVIAIPQDARAGIHRVTLVAADDESVELAFVAFVVGSAGGSNIPLLLGIAAAGVLLAVVVVLLVSRRRRKRRRARSHRREEGSAATAEDDDMWAGSVDVPDIVAPLADASATAVMSDEDPTMPVVPLVVTSGRDGSYYLLERQNPHAPRRPNGKRGWYRDSRSAPVRGIFVRTADPHTAGATASELATGENPASAHAVVDVGGVLDLLPDDIVPVARPDLDETVLVVLLAGFGVDPATDEVILDHAAVWSATKMSDHGIPARLVSPEEYQAGEGGILTDDPDLPWQRMVTLLQPSAQPSGPPDDHEDAPAPAPVDLTPPPPEPLATTPPEAPAPPEAAPAPEPESAPEDMAASEAPAPPEAAARDEAPAPPEVTVTPEAPAPEAAVPVAPMATSDPVDAELPGASAQTELPAPPVATIEARPEAPAPQYTREVPARRPLLPPSPLLPSPRLPVPPPDAPTPPPGSPAGPPSADAPALPPPAAAPTAPTASDEPATPATPAPSPPPTTPAAAGRRALPPPDELIAQASSATAFYLLEHENPHGALRANGKHGWYYPTRYGGIRAVLLHSLGGDDIGTAEGVAAHLASVGQPEAAHAVIDPDMIVDLLPDETTALHGVRSSSAALDLSLAYDPAGWGTDPAAEEAVLVRAAAWTGVRAVRHRIPVRRITVEDWRAGQRGIAGNGDVDPGPDFPWERFLQLTAWVANRVAARPATAPGGPTTGPSETVRSGNPPT